MKILFALVLFAHTYSGGVVASRIGLYESLNNCLTQKQTVLPAVLKNYGNESDLICVAVNN